MPARLYEPVFVPSRASKYATSHDYGIEDSINRVDYLSNAVLEDTYEAATRSRGKDDALLRNLNAASAEAPWYARVRASSVPPPDYSRHIRASSLPPRSVQAQQFYSLPELLPTAQLWAHRPVVLRSNVLRSARARSVEPSVRPGFYGEPVYPYLIPTSHLWAHRPRFLRKDASRLARARALEPQTYPRGLYRSASVPRYIDRASDYYYAIPTAQERALSRYLYAHRGRFGPDSKPLRPYLGDFPQVYVPWKGTGPSNRSKAAIIGSRLDAGYDGGKRQRRPRSDFAANKLREMKRDELERKYNKFG